jgi:hypothetical protein
MLSEMKAPQANYRKYTLLIVLCTIVAVALINRMNYLMYRGGFALDQYTWAMDNYYGGLTKYYFGMAETILRGSAEKDLWAYLPGYPAFIAILNVLGTEELLAVRLVQLIIDSLILFPLYFVLSRISNSALFSAVGCLIYAAAPWWSVGSTYLLAESLLPALVILLLAAMVFIRDHSTTGVNWFLLGLYSAMLPFFRSEMIFLIGPLIAWVLLVTPERKRVISTVSVAIGYALPLFLWASRNYYVHGQFILLPSVKWYAAWSGLGQVANDFGYLANDAKASGLLKQLGVEYHSAAAEDYWFNQYVDAWLTHPGHVIRTILRRFKMILGGPETAGTFTPQWVLLCYGAMAFVTPVVLSRLVRMRRATDAFLIAWPMFYALMTLGVLYTERRYVRYAGLSYLLALPVFLKMIADAFPRWLFRWRPRLLKLVACGMGIALLAACVGLQFLSMRGAAQTQLLAERLDVTGAQRPTSTLADMKFQTGVPATKFSYNAAGLELRAIAPAGAYLLIAAMDARANGLVTVRYNIALKKGGAVGLGILSGDSTQWLSHRVVAGARDETLGETLVSPVEVGSSLVIDAQDASGETHANFDGLEWAFVCHKSSDLLTMFFNKEKFKPETCELPTSS